MITIAWAVKTYDFSEAGSSPASPVLAHRRPAECSPQGRLSSLSWERLAAVSIADFDRKRKSVPHVPSISCNLAAQQDGGRNEKAR